MRLSYKIFGGSLLPFLAVIVLYHLLSARAFNGYLGELFRQKANSSLSHAEDDIRATLRHSKAQIKLLAALTPPDRRHPADTGVHFHVLLSSDEALFRLAALDAKGNQWLAVDKFPVPERNTGPRNFFSSPLYQRPMLALTTFFGNIGRYGNFPLPFIDISVPTRDHTTNDVNGVIWAKLSFQVIQSILEHHLPRDGKIMLIGADDNITLAQADDTKLDFSPLEQSARKKILAATDNHGWLHQGEADRRATFLYRRFVVNGFAFLLLYYQPDSSIYFLSHRLTEFNLYLTLAGIALFILSNSLLVRLIIRPLRGLTRSLGDLSRSYRSKGSDSQPPPALLGGDEVAQLRAAFTSFEEQLAVHRLETESFSRTLTQQVDEKTRELCAANAALKEDIARRREVEHELESHKRDLEKKVEQRAAELLQINQALQFEIQSRQRADGASRAKSLFLANMSHEIRTPMNAILGMNRLALTTELSSTQRRYLEAIQDSTESLLGIIDDILDFSKIEAGQLALEEKPFDLGECCEFIRTSFALKAQEKGLRFQVEVADDVPTDLVGDKTRLGQVLLNLVGNAVKFTDQGEVRLDVRKIIEAPGEVSLGFAVSDTGPGIAAENLRSIFESFSQADTSVSRRYGGTGLGLAISKKLAHLLAGEIRVTSEPGKGSTFTLTATFRQDTGPAAAARRPETEKKTAKPLADNLHILLVEDNLMNRELAQLLLEEKGHQVTLARDGIEALAALARQAFDCVLMDVQMPNMDGITATELIRNCEAGLPASAEGREEILAPLATRIRGSYTPIIAMTAHAMAGDREVCLLAGMDGYITKPFHPEAIFETLRQVISGASD